MASTFTDYQSITRDLTRALATTAKSPAVTARTKYFEAHIGEVKSVADLMKNYRLLSYALKAFGLEDMAGSRALVRKVLEGGVDDPKSLANKMNDARFKEFARAFDFVRHGAATTQRAEASSDVVAKFTRQTLETDAGASNDSVRLALYFTRKAPGIRTAYDILADKALFAVVRATLGLPDAMAQQNIDAQARTLEKKIDFADFRDATKTRRFVERFAAMADMTRGSTAAAAGGAGGVGIGQDLLQSLQGLKLGGF